MEYTYNSFFKSLLCYVLYWAYLEFICQGIADWPSRVWRRVRITSAIALRILIGDRKETRAWGVYWATLFLGDINMGTWAPDWGSLKSETVKCGHESCRTWT
jgi:hypothetical protein